MRGTIVNTIAILAGGGIGLFLGDKFEDRFKDIAMQGLSLAVLLIGMKMALEGENISLIIFSLLIGGLIGEYIGIEDKLNQMAKLLESKFGNKGNIAEGFIQCSLIYCVGAMAIMGAIQDGILGDPSTLYAKSLLDGFSAIAFASTLGLGVLLSAIPVLIYQGTITLLASSISIFLTDSIINDMTAVGGLLIIGISFSMFNLTKLKVGNLLPSVFVIILLSYIF
ncbi:DUF554 domain-containing protein [Halonatronum saccharophilum]|uniref:DUF554 domain-containing protein n=1 Tax=Halonatronum saccharophilum TaxID=150060 RepID=UPI00048A1DD4|nr:DUF554 domain-containing protein [Halonatronum saccharophilum]